MCEITTENMHKKLPQLRQDLANGTFLAIDCEFSGLQRKSEKKISLFDGANERYGRLSHNIEQCTIVQVGLTVFQYNATDNVYFAKVYNCHIFPRSCGLQDRQFLCQSSALEFLSRYHFDFNKFVYEGLSYVNQQEELSLQSDLLSGLLITKLKDTLLLEEERLLQSECSRVSLWVASAVIDDVLVLNNEDIYRGGKLLVYLLHKELRRRFTNTWTTTHEGCVRVQKVSPADREILRKTVEMDSKLDEEFMVSLLGFSKIFKLIRDFRKPIVGHNLLMDLMFMYKQFYKPLPFSLFEFKREINRLLPYIYDTKFLSFCMKRLVSKEENWDSNELNKLYRYFSSGMGKQFSENSPIIQLCEDYTAVGNFHEAGWDSFCTGYCFLHLAHVIHIKNDTRPAVSVNPPPTDMPPKLECVTSEMHLAAVWPFENQIHIVRARLPYICLNGPDPESDKPQVLYLESRGGKIIDFAELGEVMAKFGNGDVQKMSKYKAMVAVVNYKAARDILLHFKGNPHLKVSRYNKFRHSTKLRVLLWSGLLVSSGLFTFFVANGVKKTPKEMFVLAVDAVTSVSLIGMKDSLQSWGVRALSYMNPPKVEELSQT